MLYLFLVLLQTIFANIPIILLYFVFTSNIYAAVVKNIEVYFCFSLVCRVSGLYAKNYMGLLFEYAMVNMLTFPPAAIIALAQLAMVAPVVSTSSINRICLSFNF